MFLQLKERNGSRYVVVYLRSLRVGYPCRVLFYSLYIHKPSGIYTYADPSSRQSIKKYVQANNKINVASPAAFDAQFNKAIKAGVDKDEFTQPKGMCAFRIPSRPSTAWPLMSGSSLLNLV